MTTTGHFEFSLRIPPSWHELDLRPTTRDRSIAYMIDMRVKHTPELRPRRTEMTAFLRDLARQAWDTGSRYCASFIEPAGDSIIPGSLTVTLLPPAPSSGGNPLDSIVDQLQTTDSTADNGYWSQTTMANLKHAGPAARVFGVQPIQPFRDQPAIPMVLMNTYLPLTGGVALIAAGSPATDLDGPLLELFDTVTNTFRIHYTETN